MTMVYPNDLPDDSNSRFKRCRDIRKKKIIAISILLTLVILTVIIALAQSVQLYF